MRRRKTEAYITTSSRIISIAHWANCACCMHAAMHKGQKNSVLIVFRLFSFLTRVIFSLHSTFCVTFSWKKRGTGRWTSDGGQKSIFESSIKIFPQIRFCANFFQFVQLSVCQKNVIHHFMPRKQVIKRDICVFKRDLSRLILN